MNRLFHAAAFASSMMIVAAPAQARITQLEILRTEPAFGGESFGNTGVYERVFARAHGELDPGASGNKIIQDIELAPRNGRGMVEYTTDVAILRPADVAKSNDILLFDVPNRGSKRAMLLFNADMQGSPAAFNNFEVAGDGFLQRQGTTLIAFAWQGDVAPGDNRMMVQLPTAINTDGSPVTGVVRSELTTLSPTVSLNLSAGWFTSTPPHTSYKSVETDNTKVLADGFRPTLTVRSRANAPRQEIPVNDWKFGDCNTPNETQICLAAGFQPGKLYELIYQAKEPAVMGIGFAIARDVGAFFQQAEHDDKGVPNPVVHGPKVKSIITGSSQSGRFIRSMIALGFNRSEEGHRVYDGAMPHIGGGLMPLNIRFAQPGRAWGQQVDHDYPAYDFPFTYGRETDPVTGRSQGLLDRCNDNNTCPLIFHMATALELWEGRQSLGLTDPLGLRDAHEPENVRTFIMASTQHAPPSLPLPANPPFGLCQVQSNPNPHTWTMRAAFINLVSWVRDDTTPPASIKPSVADGTLVPADRVSFPLIPATNYGGVTRPELRYTGAVNSLQVLDFGPGFRPEDSSGILTNEPPKSGVGSYGLLVPQVDADGIDVGGVRDVYLGAPIGTYTGWNTFRPEFFDGGFCNFQGSFLPFAATKKERIVAGDPRLSLEERYPTKEAYVSAVSKAADSLVEARMLLPEDRERLVKEAQEKGVRVGP
ncbi:alpha/beta hydrolase domain-containing protein [Pseudomonas syringae]|uniref:alpha/beta hydrolase domain-containing protein n=1 Tax=Pseudomonas syringae TaxID=317 RepID=UPI000761E173|nr:alpha/beta hydrolase domain-containing protein [Pseudomonas syringae]MCK9730344.1 hypothetical protein [Pseudomonas syringae pv. syringae]